MTFSIICTTELVARTLIVLFVLLTAICGCTAMPGIRTSWLSVWDSSVGSAFET